MPKAAIFVDGNNIHRAIWECFRIERLDLEPFCKNLIQQRDLAVIHYADADFFQLPSINKYRKQQAYFSHIRSIKHLVFRAGYYRQRGSRPPEEKKVDVHLAVDMVDLCNRNAFDTAYVISGDADLTPAIEVLKREKKRVINVYTQEHFVRQGVRIGRISKLKFECDAFVRITRSLAEQYQWPPVKVLATPMI